MFSSLVLVHSSSSTTPRRRRTVGMFMAALLTLTAVSFMSSTSARATTHRPSQLATPRFIPSAWGYGTPDISLQLCTPARATWFHITMRTSDGGPWQKLCLGGKGTWNFGGANATRWTCAGNNHGSIFYDQSGQPHTLGFLPGFAADYSPYADMVNVTINGWSGDNTC